MPPRKKATYEMPEPVPKGTTFTDVSKKTWILGSSIGKGGFGEVYSAYAENDSLSKPAKYVIKVEPIGNGPLFVERNFYIRNAKEESIKTFCKERNLKCIGMPPYIASGQQDINGKSYRFIVMHKYGTDIWKLFTENNRQFPIATAFLIGAQILDVLEYIHSRNFIHADVKGTNILLSTKSKNQVYLVDFGLVTPYTKNSTFKPDKKCAHNGTIEYLSRDAHHGVQTRRGDIEILTYNLLQWLGCVLPWENNLKDPVAVQKSKEEHMSNVPNFLKTCFGSKSPPDAIVQLLKYLNSMDFNTEPDYKKIKKILLEGAVAAGGKLGGELIFKNRPSTPGNRKKKLATTPQPIKRKPAAKKPATVLSDSETEEEEPISPKPVKHVRKKKQTVLAPKANGDIAVNGDDLSGYTDAMKEIKKKMDLKGKKKATTEPKPSTSKSKGKSPTPLFHQEVVNGNYLDDSSDENVGSSNVDTRKPRNNRYNLR